MFLIRATKKRKYNGFTMQPGMFGGCDDSGYFIATCVLRKSDPGRAMRVYRFDARRGWYLTWESSETTREIIRTVFRENPRAHFGFELDCDSTPRNRLAEVHNAKDWALIM